MDPKSGAVLLNFDVAACATSRRACPRCHGGMPIITSTAYDKVILPQPRAAGCGFPGLYNVARGAGTRRAAGAGTAKPACLRTRAPRSRTTSPRDAIRDYRYMLFSWPQVEVCAGVAAGPWNWMFVELGTSRCTPRRRCQPGTCM